jgi:hypothetical protein
MAMINEKLKIMSLHKTYETILHVQLAVQSA